MSHSNRPFDQEKQSRIEHYKRQRRDFRVGCATLSVATIIFWSIFLYIVLR